MTPAELVKRLLAEQDLKYRDFHASLLPNIDKKTIIGVRVPTMRKIAKEFAAAGSAAAKSVPADVARFLDKLPHKYFEENQVHLLVVERIKDFNECLYRIEQFLPYIDNWAVCDSFCAHAKWMKRVDKELLWSFLQQWFNSENEFEVRFAVVASMCCFLEADGYGMT